jgi:hypothetical protein
MPYFRFANTVPGAEGVTECLYSAWRWSHLSARNTMSEVRHAWVYCYYDSYHGNAAKRFSTLWIIITRLCLS